MTIRSGLIEQIVNEIVDLANAMYFNMPTPDIVVLSRSLVKRVVNKRGRDSSTNRYNNNLYVDVIKQLKGLGYDIQD